MSDKAKLRRLRIKTAILHRGMVDVDDAVYSALDEFPDPQDIPTRNDLEQISDDLNNLSSEYESNNI